jgi:HEPN domain-containing protein
LLFDEAEYSRWIESARRTLLSARRDSEAGDYNWACFKAHQAAEKALKALLWGVGRPQIGHSLPRLLESVREMGIDVPEDIVEACIRLNKFYTPTRYPDAWSEGIPEEYYSKREAEEAIQWASRVIEWVESVWRELLKRGEGRQRER